jgi:CRISPR-associated endonuclease/helicase Cas3
MTESAAGQSETFTTLFRQATGGNDPWPYQIRLAVAAPFPSLLDVPTGLGKTAAAVLAWVWRRRFADESVRKHAPRRLIYCLPMRVLVEQTFSETVKWLDRLGLLAGAADWTKAGPDGLPTRRAQLKRTGNGQGRGYVPDPAAIGRGGWASQNGDLGQHPIAVHLLLGGEEKSDWALWPERDAILIGTQDMLISRTLNRGYAAGRARWPFEFGLINSDCLWVFDEIQIMNTSLATSLQLDAWRRSLRLRPSRDEFPAENAMHLPKPCSSLWMSATMAKHWLERAVDWSSYVAEAWQSPHCMRLGQHEFPGGQTVSDDDSVRVKGLFANTKKLEKTPVATLAVPRGKDSKPDVAGYLDRLVPQILEHRAAAGLTLVIVNTVDRAVDIYRRLQQAANGAKAHLIHSRFRPMEREQWSAFLSCKDGQPRIVVSTQVIEAGVDLSANALFTELAPWASLVQRFGRCARFIALDNEGKVINEHGTVYWMDITQNERAVLPYSVEELTASRSILQRPDVTDVGLQALKALRSQLDAQATALFPYDPRFVPRDKDLFDLFDTTPDLTGADVDVSRYIRDGEELDIQVFWREIEANKEPDKKDRPHRREFCAVKFLEFRRFAREALKEHHRIWRRRYSTGRNRTSPWERLDLGSVDQVVYPGQVFLLEKSCGGYSTELGWTGNAKDTAFELPIPLESVKVTTPDEEDDADDLSQVDLWLSILDHTRDVCGKLEEILDPAGLTNSELKVLRLAARWHDRGKAHPAFTAKVKAEALAVTDVQSKLNKELPAKAPDDAWRRDKVRRQVEDTPDTQKDRRRPGHRHELASALAILETLNRGRPDHPAFAWEPKLAGLFNREAPACDIALADDPLVTELAELSADELDLLVYLVAAHHGKVRMSLRSSPDDDRDDVPDPCPVDKRQARGVRDEDTMPPCRIPAANLNAAGIVAPEVTLSLDPMELGLSPRYGASWRERMQLLLERLGPFRLGYLEALLRAADCRASAEEDARGKEGN